MLERFEHMLEGAIEGGLRRVFPAALQPVQLAKAAARSMERALVVGLQGPIAPSSFEVAIAPGDGARFRQYRRTLERELSEYLAAYAQDRGFRLDRVPEVTLVEDATVRPGTVRADASFVDAEGSGEAVAPRTALLTPPNVDQGADVTGWLEDAVGQRHALADEEELVRIGRALENDIVLDDPRVSRYHAHLRRQRDGWVVVDLDSTNGTRVNGARVGERPVPLQSGATLRVAERELTFHTGPRAARRGGGLS